MPGSFGSMPSFGGGGGGGGGAGSYASYIPMLMSLFGGGGQQQVQAPLPVDNIGLLGGKVGDSGLRGFRQASNAQIGGIDNLETEPFSKKSEGDTPNPFVGFFDKLDTNLQSPSKQIGLGLLGQQDPRLAVAGLIAMGLLGGNDDSTANR